METPDKESIKKHENTNPTVGSVDSNNSKNTELSTTPSNNNGYPKQKFNQEKNKKFVPYNKNHKFRSGNNFFYKKKSCYFKRNKITYIDYKEVDIIKKFVGRAGQITAPRFSGTSHKHQRKLSQAIKRARFMGLLPYVGYVEREKKQYTPYNKAFSNRVVPTDVQKKELESTSSQ